MPMLVGDRVYTVGVSSKFHCLDKKTGQALWSHDLYKEFKGTVMVYGYSCQPLPYKNIVILMVGGAEHALMAFNQKNGSVVWQKHYFFNSNSSPILINVDGQDQAEPGRLGNRSNSRSQAILRSSCRLHIARCDGLRDCILEKREQRLQKLTREQDQ